MSNKIIRIGPLSVDETSAKKIGWSGDMIDEAVVRVKNLSLEITNRVGTDCEHCGLFVKYPPGIGEIDETS